MCYKDDVKRFNEIFFWEAEYLKRKAFQELGEKKCGSIRAHLCFLFDKYTDPKLGDDTIRYSLNAIYNMQELGGSSYYNKIPREVLPIYKELLILSMHYGYSADILMYRVHPAAIIKKIMNGKHFLSAPPPFFTGDDHYFYLFKVFIFLEFNSKNVEYYPVGEKEKSAQLDSLAIERRNSTCDILDASINKSKLTIADSDMLKSFSNFLRHYPHDLDNLKLKWPEKDKAKFLKIMAKYKEHSFHKSSSMGRAVGLYLWDKKYLYPNKTLESFYEPLMHITDEKSSNNPSYYENKYERTKECIDKGLVLKI